MMVDKIKYDEVAFLMISLKMLKEILTKHKEDSWKIEWKPDKDVHRLMIQFYTHYAT